MSRPVILFESYPDFNGSALAIYEELVRRGYDKKYDLVWAVYSDFNLKTNYKTIKFFGCNSTAKSDIIKRTKCIIDSNRYIPKFSSNVYRIHVRHGACLKNIVSYCKTIGSLDAIPTTSDEMLKIDRACYPRDIANKFIVLGMPATDKLFHPNDVYNGFIQELTGMQDKFNKIICWLPTFRDHRHCACGKNRFIFGLPAIHTTAEYAAINERLKSHNMLLIVQMHHAQAKNYKQLPNCSNIVFVNEQIKTKYGISTADILGNSDALITDYSAAYHEYVILDRPIALTIEDLVAFSKTKGFVCNYLDWVKGDYLLNNADLLQWIDDIFNNIDANKTEREYCMHKIHKYIDDNSTTRITDFIVKNAKL